MEILDFSRSKALNSIPKKKLIEILDNIETSEPDLVKRSLKLMAVNRYAESNIPIEYWFLKMEKDFTGDPRLLEEYKKYVIDIKDSYLKGKSLCLAGQHGLGKSMTTSCILKKACVTGYSALHTNLSDIVNVLIQASGEEKFLARRELTMVDFLVIDEFDSRFMPSENAADLYARSLETIFRTRSQNKLPTLMCTNSPNIVESLNGSLKQSIDSLMKGYLTVFPVFGDDFRKKNK